MSENLVEVSDYLRDQLIFLHTSFKTSSDLFTAINKAAQENGFVTDQFLPKIIKREATFPTGLQLEHRGVAIPHTDADTINKEFVAVVINDEPIEFSRMDDPDQTVSAKLVFVLGLNKPHAQLDMLQALMGIIQDNELVNSLENANDADQIHQLLS
ncbi:PTS sugar transporter subunit IIA [Lactiplantibacillus pentosus]|uniref:PTS sugar transporter subunit IIA n=1 Tax=Lactiplantibacillus pentosus TaxID=1589 RepID=UPI0013305B6F|nr:PTS sugar transporter subunit IIA [Lactiplantibacillus pentosus]MBQ0834975.1 PTS sugar transporter subunit IIA [Lactiplantibacillus pentosus]MBU7464817.1 PTS sugar transporter subunit IIA [Lactiplantibacillus pentosus]MBU7490805.1 PTS sugar transporter subunit IIA [Lactiplantibacillus pentosus]MBU7492927.1 PTS sugar transporter subunit IIA [Lactiplantibacillus pentosus]MBU7518952.1 PTS sugar transporter subunit IIA [Lactiplantibacillus pentosus]